MDVLNWWKTTEIHRPDTLSLDSVPKKQKDDYKWKDYGEDELGDVAADYSDEEGEYDDNVSPVNIHFREEMLAYTREVTNASPWDAPWKRPIHETVPENFNCQHIESTYSVMSDRGYKFPEVRMFATSERGESVCLRVQNFKPYFYAQIDDPDYAQIVRGRLEEMLCKNMKSKKNQVNGKYILKFEQVKKRTIWGYHRNAPLTTMYKITTALPCHVKSCRDALEGRNAATNPEMNIITYEANVLFELRYMVDHNISGCQWLNVDLKQAVPVVGHEKVSTCQYEMICNNPETIKPMDKSEIAPIRILSLDIECRRMASSGFVNAEQNDPAIVICCELATSGGKTLHKACFAYFPNPEHYMTPLPDDTVCHVFRNEESMLLAFSQYIRECDPDIFTGWNTNGFDWPYLVKRAQKLGIGDEFMSFTRIKNKTASMRSSMIKSKAYGAKKVNELICEGRFIYDGLEFMLRGQMKKYREYTLNHIAHETVGDTKLDVHYSQIKILHDGTDEDRETLVEYCLKDASLPLRVLEKLMAMVNGVEQSRVTGVPLKWLLTKGQGPKTFSKILRTKGPNVVVPSKSPKVENTFTKGGFVRAPIQGFHRHPVSTFDFASLYPSIMQAYNICYSTVESLAWARANLKPEDYWIPPSEGDVEPDFCFVKEHIHKGVLPDLLTDLLGQRAYVKNLMKKVDKDSDLYAIYDGRQMALKVVCNSVYGFLKAFILVDPRLMAAVTAWGQQMIMKTADIIVKMFETDEATSFITDRAECERLGMDYEDYKNPNRPVKKCKPVVLYGDTDSVVVDFGDIGVQELANISRRVAKTCTEAMVKPNSLSFESIKLRVKLYKKKKYCSLELLSGNLKPEYNTEMACKAAEISYKGIESKRRDNAKIGSETQQHVLEMILKDGDIKGAEEFVKKVIMDVLMDRVDMSKFVISKGLSKTYEEYSKSKAQPAHVILSNKIRQRSKFTGEVDPDTGDRVPMVFVRGSKNQKSTQLAEDPVFVQKNGLILDKKYYIMKQIFGATIRIFTCIYEPEKLDLIKSNMSNKKMREFKAFHILFQSVDKHMLRVKHNNVKVGIGEFTIAEQQCLEPTCRVRLHDPRAVVCDSHQLVEAYAHVKEIETNLVKAKEQAWTRCSDCARGRFDVHSCQNTVCDNFFHRNKTVVDVEDIGKVLSQSMKHLSISPSTGNPKRIAKDVKNFQPVHIDWSKVKDPEELKKRPKWGKEPRGKKRPSFVKKEEKEEVLVPVPKLIASEKLKQTGLLAFGVTAKKRGKNE